MPATLISLRVEALNGKDGRSRVGVSWYLGATEGLILCESLEDALEHIARIIRADQESHEVDVHDL